jgi:S-adenosylmethionine synthetase
MFEKVSKYHPDKVADRIGGALTDLAYTKQKDPKVAIEVLIGHGVCHIINETSVHLDDVIVSGIVSRIAGPKMAVDYVEVPQDTELAKNQKHGIKCGDNGIFLGVPVTAEEWALAKLAYQFDLNFASDGKYMIDLGRKALTICQSNASKDEIADFLGANGYDGWDATINPLGEWTGGTSVDCGATNRKLGSDLAESVTGGGTAAKDYSKADVSATIYCWLRAQATGKPVHGICSIGDDSVLIDGEKVPYSEIVRAAREFIAEIGGFENFAEYGLVSEYSRGIVGGGYIR